MPKIKSKKLKNLKKSLKKKTYDFEKAIEKSAEKIVNNPEVLLWR